MVYSPLNYIGIEFEWQNGYFFGISSQEGAFTKTKEAADLQLDASIA